MQLYLLIRGLSNQPDPTRQKGDLPGAGAAASKIKGAAGRLASAFPESRSPLERRVAAMPKGFDRISSRRKRKRDRGQGSSVLFESLNGGVTPVRGLHAEEGGMTT